MSFLQIFKVWELSIEVLSQIKHFLGYVQNLIFTHFTNIDQSSDNIGIDEFFLLELLTDLQGNVNSSYSKKGRMSNSQINVVHWHFSKINCHFLNQIFLQSNFLLSCIFLACLILRLNSIHHVLVDFHWFYFLVSGACVGWWHQGGLLRHIIALLTICLEGLLFFFLSFRFVQNFDAKDVNHIDLKEI